MTRNSLLLPLCWLALYSASSAASVSLNISSGYLFNALGTAEEHRLPAGSLCVLVADLDGDGFNPIVADGSWVGGADMLVSVLDSEHVFGTFGFDLTAGTVSEPGLFSRTLTIDLAQFGTRVNPVPIALRWFPTLAAATTDLLASSPTIDTPYGQFSRAVPRYTGMSAWIIDLTGGSALDLDPLATPEFGGEDSPASAMASFTVIPEPSSIVATLSGLAFLLARRSRNTELRQ